MKQVENNDELPSNIIDFLDVSQTAVKRRKSLHSNHSIDQENLTNSPSRDTSFYENRTSTSIESFANIVRKSMDSFGLLGVRPSDWEVAAEVKMLDTLQKLNLKMFDEELKVLNIYNFINFFLSISSFNLFFSHTFIIYLFLSISFILFHFRILKINQN